MLDLSAELDFVRGLALACGELALGVRAGGREALRVRHKPRGQGPVTEADSLIDERIVSALRKRFPGDGVVAEESAVESGWEHARRCWFIDPIDGTREFTRGTSDWTVQVGLCIEGRPVLGVVVEPGRARLCWGVIDALGARTGQVDRGAPTALREPETARSFADVRLIGGKLYPFSPLAAIGRALGIPRSRMTAVGSTGIRILAVARGEADVYVQPPGSTRLWDTSGPAAVLLAAGGRITDLEGEPLDYHNRSTVHARGIVATRGHEHAEVIARLASLAREWFGVSPRAPR